MSLLRFHSLLSSHSIESDHGSLGLSEGSPELPILAIFFEGNHGI